MLPHLITFTVYGQLSLELGSLRPICSYESAHHFIKNNTRPCSPDKLTQNLLNRPPTDCKLNQISASRVNERGGGRCGSNKWNGLSKYAHHITSRFIHPPNQPPTQPTNWHYSYFITQTQNEASRVAKYNNYGFTLFAVRSCCVCVCVCTSV